MIFHGSHCTRYITFSRLYFPFFTCHASGKKAIHVSRLDPFQTHCLLTDQDKMCIFYRGPAIDASYQVSVHLAKWFQRRNLFRNQPIRNKNSLWRPCLLTDRDEMCNLYRKPSIDASYLVSIHLVKRFQGRRFFKINQSETRIACSGHIC